MRAVVDADAGFQRPLKYEPSSSSAVEELLRELGGVGILEPDLVELDLGVDEAAEPVEVGIVVDLEAQPRGHGDVAVGIAVDEAAPAA